LDDLTVPFALTAGLSSLGKSSLVILGDTAELVAGTIIMGIGGFLASQAERDHYRYVRCTTPDLPVIAIVKSFVKYFVMNNLALESFQISLHE
jgi:hypothetical protein